MSTGKKVYDRCKHLSTRNGVHDVMHVYVPITTYWDGWWRLTIYEERRHAARERCPITSRSEGFAVMWSVAVASFTDHARTNHWEHILGGYLSSLLCG